MGGEAGGGGGFDRLMPLKEVEEVIGQWGEGRGLDEWEYLRLVVTN